MSAASYPDTSFSIRNLMQFDGPAPELINGRAAMLGFVAALFMEIYTGKPVLEQAIEEPRCILVAFTLILVASLYPMGKNATPQTEQHTIFKAEAEIWGGRAACVPSAATLSRAVCFVRMFDTQGSCHRARYVSSDATLAATPGTCVLTLASLPACRMK